MYAYNGDTVTSYSVWIACFFLVCTKREETEGASEELEGIGRGITNAGGYFENASYWLIGSTFLK